jgi:hypothetical protein
MKKEKGNSLLAAALLFVITFVICCSPIMVYGNSLPNNYLIPANSRLGADNSTNLFLPLIVKCCGCENLIGDWKINTPDETHSAGFFPNGTFSMIFQGETSIYYGNYSCTGGQFEGLIATETDSLKIKGALTCNGNGMSGTWEIRNNGILIKTGDFSGQKL